MDRASPPETHEEGPANRAQDEERKRAGMWQWATPLG
jgi:hypothetical protein